MRGLRSFRDRGFGKFLLQRLLNLLGQGGIIGLGYLQNGGQEGAGGNDGVRGGALGKLLSALLGGARSGKQIQHMGGFVSLGIFFACGHETGSFPKYQELGKTGLYIRTISLMSSRKSRATLESGA